MEKGRNIHAQLLRERVQIQRRQRTSPANRFNPQRQLRALVPCRNFLLGPCPKGNRCEFSHNPAIREILLRNDTPVHREPSGVSVDVDSMTYEQLLELGERMGTVAVGVPPDILARIPCITVQTASGDEKCSPTCPICLDDFPIGSRMKLLPCAHTFHSDCIDKWLQSHSRCPTCKQEVQAQ